MQFDRAKRALQDALVCFSPNRAFEINERQQDFTAEFLSEFCCIYARDLNESCWTLDQISSSSWRTCGEPFAEDFCVKLCKNKPCLVH